MLELYSKATITPEDATVVDRAIEIVVEANAKAKKWNRQKTDTRKIFHKAVIKSHIVDNQPHCGGESSCRMYPSMVLEKGRPCRAYMCPTDARSNNRGYKITLSEEHPCHNCGYLPDNCTGAEAGQCERFQRYLKKINPVE